MSSSSTTERFTGKAAYYKRTRPSYPPEMLTLLEETISLSPKTIIADIGSGTGLLTELFLKNGNTVYGIEPNTEMRTAGEEALASYPRFTSFNGTSEATTLPSNSIELITVGQAFHWFDPVKSRTEFTRILKPGGWVLLVWNAFIETPVVQAQQTLIKQFNPQYRGEGYQLVSDNLIEALYGKNAKIIRATFTNGQTLDRASFIERILSSSYAPTQEDSNYTHFVTQLNKVFEEAQRDGQVLFEYHTEVYLGQLL